MHQVRGTSREKNEKRERERGKKVILASNIAESSLTLPKIRVVIDFGLRRHLIYDPRRHMSCLVTVWTSQASAKQRAET